jgi:Na+/phosphate symporter
MKCKIIRVDPSYYSDGYAESPFLYPVTLDWEEVTEKEFHKLKQAVYISNQMNRGQYVLVSYDQSYADQIFQNAKDWHQAQKEYAEKEAKRKETERSVLERKRKQLEKLKSELGE